MHVVHIHNTCRSECEVQHRFTNKRGYVLRSCFLLSKKRDFDHCSAMGYIRDRTAAAKTYFPTRPSRVPYKAPEISSCLFLSTLLPPFAPNLSMVPSLVSPLFRGCLEPPPHPHWLTTAFLSVYYYPVTFIKLSLFFNFVLRLPNQPPLRKFFFSIPEDQNLGRISALL